VQEVKYWGVKGLNDTIDLINPSKELKELNKVNPAELNASRSNAASSPPASITATMALGMVLLAILVSPERGVIVPYPVGIAAANRAA